MKMKAQLKMTFVPLIKMAFLFLLMCCVVIVEGVGTRKRFYDNDTSVECQGIICPKDKIFVPCTIGDGRHDFCEPCPSERPKTIESPFDSSHFEEPPENHVCVNPADICKCMEEAELVNEKECFESLNPVCQCRVKSGYYGDDPMLCKLSDNDKCRESGYELNLNGSCTQCRNNTYKDMNEITSCLPQPSCAFPLVVDNPGDIRTKVTCKPDQTLLLTTVAASPNTNVKTVHPQEGSPMETTSNTSIERTTTKNETDVNWRHKIVPILWKIVIPGFIIAALLCLVMCSYLQYHKRRFPRRGQRRDQDAEEYFLSGNFSSPSRQRSLFSCQWGKLQHLRNVFKGKSKPNAIPLTVTHHVTTEEQENINNILPCDQNALDDPDSSKTSNTQVEQTHVKTSCNDAFSHRLGMEVEQTDVETSYNNALSQTDFGILSGECAFKSDVVSNRKSKISKLVTQKYVGKNQSEETEPKVSCGHNTVHKGTNKNGSMNGARLCYESSQGNSSHSYRYHLTWRQDGSEKGFLEYRDACGIIHRSSIIPNGGSAILNSQNEILTENVTFVSSNSRVKTQSWVQVEVEKTPGSLDFESLLKSETANLSFNSFRVVVQNRQVDNMASNDYHDSAEQPNHMSLPHSLHQADSGIENTMTIQTDNESNESVRA